MNLEGIVLDDHSRPDALHQLVFRDDATRRNCKCFEDFERATAERYRSAHRTQLSLFEIELPSGVLEKAYLNLSQNDPNLSGSIRIDKITEGQIAPSALQQLQREYFSFFQDLSRYLSRERLGPGLKTRSAFTTRCVKHHYTFQPQHLRARSMRTNDMEPSFAGATKEQVEQAAALAWDAFPVYKETSLEDRARFLEAIAEGILAIGDELVLRAIDETGLPRGRIEGERARTVGQLRLFAKEVRDGVFQELRFDPADADRKPAAKPDLRLRNIALGPVVVFGASNFPLAFSVAGGDTASALAAGCPVIVKAHSAHPGTSALVGKAVVDAVAAW